MVRWLLSRDHWDHCKFLHVFQKPLDQITPIPPVLYIIMLISKNVLQYQIWRKILIADTEMSPDCLLKQRIYELHHVSILKLALLFHARKKCMFNILSMQCLSAARMNNSKRLMFEHILQHSRIKGESSRAAISKYWSMISFGTRGLLMLAYGKQANHEG